MRKYLTTQRPSSYHFTIQLVKSKLTIKESLTIISIVMLIALVSKKVMLFLSVVVAMKNLRKIPVKLRGTAN